MRVLIAGLKWPPETFLARLIRGLANAGVEVVVASAGRPDAAWRQTPGIEWVYAPNWAGNPLRRLARLAAAAATATLRSPKAVLRLAAAPGDQPGHVLSYWHRMLPLTGRSFDLVYLPWTLSGAAYGPLFRLGVPVVTSCRGAHVNVRPHTTGGRSVADQLRNVFARTAVVHCVSEHIRVEALRYGLDPAKTSVIRPAVDPDFFIPASFRTPQAGFTVITTGRLIWIKGYDYALCAIRQLVDRGIDVRFDVIGDGPERQQMLYTIRDLDLSDRVRLLGRLPPEKVREHLWNADAFLLSSLSEGISNAVLEAMSCGLPVVTTDCGGMAEAVRNGVDGYVVPVRSAPAMADALERLARDPALAATLAASARARVEQEFTLDAQVHAFFTLFEETVERGVAAAGDHDGAVAPGRRGNRP